MGVTYFSHLGEVSTSLSYGVLQSRSTLAASGSQIVFPIASAAAAAGERMFNTYKTFPAGERNSEENSFRTCIKTYSHEPMRARTHKKVTEIL